MPIHSPFPLLRSMAGTWFPGVKAEEGKASSLEGLPDTLRSQAERWAELWGLPGLTDSVTVEFSRRFRSSLGLCRPTQSRIRLAAHLEKGNGDLLEEVLCHELAHVAVYRLYGRAARPHGPEWKSLVSAAGFKPRARFKRAEGRFPPRSQKARARWEHRCPECGAMRIAGRPVRNWRCGDCYKAGRSGKLIITRIPAEG